jgi:hypothetical protein
MRFRIRSASRDSSTDLKRLQSIENSTSKAIADAEAEKSGLERRMRSATNNAAMLIGNDTFEYLDREPETERLLLDEEKTIMTARNRIQQLGAHLDHLRRILEAVRAR